MSLYKSTTIWSGNTYPIRDVIRQLGGKWDAERKVWVVPPLTMQERTSLHSLTGGMKGIQVTKV